jgi:uncharacterized OB-fold protein
MKKIYFLMIALVLISAAGVYAYSDGDFQVWNTDSQDFKVNKNLKAVFEEEFRWGGNASEFYYHHYDAGLLYKLNQYWNVGGGYRHVYELSKRKFKLENEPYVIAAVSLANKGFMLDSRSRLEYRHFDYQADSWRYRNKFTVKFPWKFTKMEIQPYAADEIFVKLGSSIGQFNQNRVSCGFNMNLTANLKAELYYMLVSAKSSGTWKDTNVLGAKLKLSF